MAGPKSSSNSSVQAQHQKQDEQKQQDGLKQQQSELSYKAKLMAPSSHDDLSAPDQTQELPKLPPSKDEGSPPMVPETAADSTAGESLASTGGGDQEGGKPVDNDGFVKVGKGEASDLTAATAQGDAGGEAEMEEGEPGPVSPGDVADVTSVDLSDVDKQALADPSTADLVAAATGHPPTGTPEAVPDVSAEATHPQTGPGGTLGKIEPLPDSNENQLAKGSIAAINNSSSSSTADTAAATAGEDSDGNESSNGVGAAGASSAAAAADGSEGDASLPTPAAAAEMAGVDATASPAAAAVSEERAQAAAAAELPEKGGEADSYTPADFAATGLAAFEAEADAAAAEGRGAAGGADRMSSVMTDRTDSGWYERSYSTMMPSSMVELAGMDKEPGMEPVSEKSDEIFSDDIDAAAPKSDTPFSNSESSTQKNEAMGQAGPPQGYPALAQAPAVSDDAAAVPAPPQPEAATAADATAAATADGGAGEGSAAAAVDIEGQRIFAGQGSGKDSGRGGVTVSAADLGEPEAEEGVFGGDDFGGKDFAGNNEGKGTSAVLDTAPALREVPTSAQAAVTEQAAAATAAEGDEGPSTAAAADPAASTAAAPYIAEAPAGETSEGEGELSEKVENLPLPLKLAGGAAKAVIDSIADVGEAVKDVLIGPDV